MVFEFLLLHIYYILNGISWYIRSRTFKIFAKMNLRIIKIIINKSSTPKMKLTMMMMMAVGVIKAHQLQGR